MCVYTVLTNTSTRELSEQLIMMLKNNEVHKNKGFESRHERIFKK